MISIGVLDGSVREDGEPVRLSSREAEYLMLTAAAHAGLQVPAISSGANTRVLINRIRRRFTRPVLLSAGSGRYILAPDVRVDVVQMLLGAPESTQHELRMAIRRMPANPYRACDWFASLEHQLDDIAHTFLSASTL
jgi:hypothetical protein